MCGPSSSEKQLEASEVSFDSTLQQDYSQTFAQNQEILSNLNSVLQPIVNAGPNQEGFSPAETAALSTQAIESNAQGVNQAEAAAQASEDAAGSGRSSLPSWVNTAGAGTSLLPSGVNAQINAEIGSAAEANLSSEQLGITEQNYATGRANWQQALAGEEKVAAGESPVSYAGATTNANQAAFGEANAINQQSNQEFSDILGSIPGFASAGLAGASAITSAVNPNADTGVLDALAGVF